VEEQAVKIQFGLETEIGITRADATDLDVVAESIALVRSAQGRGVRMRWDYEYEDPHLDARGFRVKELRQDTDEAHYFARDAARELTYSEIKSDLALKNGARYYNDHAHPEYCTPECSTLLELLQQDYAGDQLLMHCARAVTEEEPEDPVSLYKNNTDFQGHSYGCHENYLVPRDLPWDDLAQGMQAFLVTRQIFCGAGKFGWEDEDRFVKPGFQIAQRSDFFSVLQSVDTMQKRPIVNTRDEPHADQNVWRRFHVIIGDANMSPYATWLKVGTTALVLQALANGAEPGDIPRLKDPIAALKSISHDPEWDWHCLLKRGFAGAEDSDAVTVQRFYLNLVKQHVPGLDEQWTQLVEAWENILDDLESDPLSTADRLDWSAKYALIEQFREAEGLSEEDPWLRSLDLSYHHLDEEQGLFYGLRDQGHFRLPYPREQIEPQRLEPPATTRAAVRGLALEKFGAVVDAAQWDMVRFSLEDKRYLQLDLRRLFDREKIRETVEALRQASHPRELESLWLAKITK
jgi:proteasome accessory factor A